MSHRLLVEMRGHDYRSPLSAMRAYLKDMHEARFDAAQPEYDPSWLLAALGPKMLELSRDLADGAHPPGDPAAYSGGLRDPRRQPLARRGAGGGPDDGSRGRPKACTLSPEPLHAAAELTATIGSASASERSSWATAASG